MQYVDFGRTGLRVSRLGFGGIPVQRIDEPGTRAMLKAAHEAGINYIDTARAYTVSEEWIGQALEELGLRDEFILATKCRALTKAEMEAELAASLKNMAGYGADGFGQCVHGLVQSAVDGRQFQGEACFELNHVATQMRLRAGSTCASARRAPGKSFSSLARGPTLLDTLRTSTQGIPWRAQAYATAKPSIFSRSA